MAAPGRCLTWGPAAALSVSALAARAQLARTTNPDGWPGAASNRAAFTDVVPKSIPRVTGREAMAAVTAQLRWLEPQAEELHPRRAARGLGFPANLLTAPIGRGKQTHTCSSQRPPVIGGERTEGGTFWSEVPGQCLESQGLHQGAQGFRNTTETSRALPPLQETRSPFTSEPLSLPRCQCSSALPSFPQPYQVLAAYDS